MEEEVTALPYVFLDAVWHIGSPTLPGATLQPRAIKNWDFEFGLLSVSLDPEAWRAGWAGSNGTIFELSATNKKLQFLDADETLASFRPAIVQAGLAGGFIQCPANGIEATDLLYLALNLVSGSQLPLKNRSFEDQLLQAVLAVLASQDPSIDGLWWSDLSAGEIRTARGGIFQHLLPKRNVKVVSNVVVGTAPLPTFMQSDIL